MTVRYWRLILIAWMALIFTTSSSLFSFESTKQVLIYNLLNYVVRKSAHIAEYAALTYFWFRALWTVQERFYACVVWSTALAILYAASDEWHQSFVPGRLGIWTDVVWDAVGATAMGLGLLAVWYRGEANVQRRLLGAPVVAEKTVLR